MASNWPPWPSEGAVHARGAASVKQGHRPCFASFFKNMVLSEVGKRFASFTIFVFLKKKILSRQSSCRVHKFKTKKKEKIETDVVCFEKEEESGAAEGLRPLDRPQAVGVGSPAIGSLATEAPSVR